jgi:hypothetical protein
METHLMNEVNIAPYFIMVMLISLKYSFQNE